MSEYNIPVLVKWFAEPPGWWDGDSRMAKLMGTVIMCKEQHTNYRYLSVRGSTHPELSRHCWHWKAQDVIPNPTPSQIEEEARKAGKATVTTEKREPKLYKAHDYPKNPDLYVETGEVRCPKKGEFYLMACGEAVKAGFTFHVDKCRILTKYTPEAAQSAQKGPMEPKQVTKQIKETIAAKALREAMDKVKADQERVDGLKAIVALEADKRKAKEHMKGIDDQIATLSKKWLKGVGK